MRHFQVKVLLAAFVLVAPADAARPPAEPWSLTKAEDVELNRMLLDRPAPPEATAQGGAGDWIYRAQMGWPIGAILRSPVSFASGPITYKLPAGAALGLATMVGEHRLANGDPAIYCTNAQYRKTVPDVKTVGGDITKADFYYADWFRVCLVDSDFDKNFDKAFISLSRKKSLRTLSAIGPVPFDTAVNISIPGDNGILISQKPDPDSAEKAPRIWLTVKANYRYFKPDYVTFNCRGVRTQYTLKSSKRLRKGERFAFAGVAVSYDRDDAAGRPVLGHSGSLDGCKLDFQSRAEMIFVFY